MGGREEKMAGYRLTLPSLSLFLFLFPFTLQALSSALSLNSLEGQGEAGRTTGLVEEWSALERDRPKRTVQSQAVSGTECCAAVVSVTATGQALISGLDRSAGPGLSEQT